MTQEHIGDARELLSQIKNVQTFFTDPPYNNGSDYGPVDDRKERASYELMLADVLDVAWEASAEDASFFMVHYPEEIAMMWPRLTERWDFHQWISWVYPANFGHSKRRWTRAHRTLLWLKKEQDPKFHPRAVVQPYKNPNDKRIKKLMEQGRKGTHLYDWWEVNLCKNVSNEYQGYSNQIPEEVIKRAILCTTDEGDLVADPFAGTFSTVRTAIKHGRRGWGCDLNPETQRFVPDGIETLVEGQDKNAQEVPAPEEDADLMERLANIEEHEHDE